MTVYTSFAFTWFAFSKGKLSIEDLVSPNILLVFNCKQEYLYPKSDKEYVPKEVALAINIPTKDAKINRSALPTGILEKWDLFIEALDYLKNDVCQLFFSDHLKDYRISVKGTVAQACKAVHAHGCRLRKDGIHSQQDDRPNPCTIMTVSANLMLLGIWFNEYQEPATCQHFPVGVLLFYNKENKKLIKKETHPIL